MAQGSEAGLAALDRIDAKALRGIITRERERRASC